ncbi:hypothetical protein SeMB42_g00974 [Synchytrium endobioticum]|uniref:NmrA-like domain-containing protein n=1 Tax=Synchytrium endobioticum TaxID=286115 RepID=A0A507DN77_9FUNG|nr:hypothetical protein SeLEV6574_g04120 [Synchytrium endobioticum]TPX53124.1 hypothetical protein SeMB42_g00974 [Synchytrium endobioticum]
MSETGYKHIAVLGGTGKLARQVSIELVTAGFKVKVFSRDPDASVPDAETVVVRDPTDVTALISKLEGVDAVVSTLAIPAGVGAQTAAIKAAAAAGVKRFIPSEFGIDHYYNRTDPEFQPKKDALDLIKSLGLEYTVIVVGLFIEAGFDPSISFDVPNGVARIVQFIDSPVSYTSLKDTGRVVAGTLRSKDAANRLVSVASESLSDREVIDILEKVTGTRYMVMQRKLEEVYDELEKKPNFGLLLAFLKGRGTIYHDNEFSKYVKEKPYTVKEFLTVTKGGLENTVHWYDLMDHDL